MKNHKKGFTLIELLVVIAIIGLLSSVVFASLSVARKKGRIAAMQSNMHEVQLAATLCMDEGRNLNSPSVANASVCQNSPTLYPVLPNATWGYSAGDLDTSDGKFSIAASSSSLNDNATITCKESGCTTTSP